MSEVDLDDRLLFEESGRPLYERALVQDGIGHDDPTIAGDGADWQALQLLLSLGLLVNDSRVRRYLPVEPTAVQARIVAPLTERGRDLLTESAEWATGFASLAASWRRSSTDNRGYFTLLTGEAINSFIANTVADSQEELLTAQPQAGRNAPTLAVAAERDLAALERGVKMRTLYQHSARRNSSTHRYVVQVTARGAEVRTLDEFFNRLIVVDRQVAVIPGGAAGALAVREPMVVDYLVDMFDRHWERARPFGTRETRLLREVAVEQRAMTTRMLIRGHADPVSAKRLGVSPRTFASYVADLKAEYDAESRFQLGYAMGLLGVSGDETLDEADGSAEPGQQPREP